MVLKRKAISIKLLKSDFNKVALQLYWNRFSACVFSCKFAAYFQNTFSEEHLRVATSAVCMGSKFGIEMKWSEPCGKQINWQNIASKTLKEYWQRPVYLPFLDIAFAKMKPRSVKKGGHIINYTSSSSSMIKVRWQRNRIMLYHHQHTYIVHRPDEDHFESHHKKIHCHCILFKYSRSSDTVPHSCRKHGGERGLFPM